MYSLIKSVLFSLPPERAHDAVLNLARLSPPLGALSGQIPPPSLAIRVGANQWRSPIGLAAGLDKNAEGLDFFAGQGFGALECGTVTLRPQLGNPKPRIWRYPDESSLRNAMGFPNQGLEAIAPRLRAYHGVAPLGINIGMNKDSSPEESIFQLTRLLSSLKASAAYFVINVSSPNTPGLRKMQERPYLSELFHELNKIREGRDLYLKIAPDLEREKVLDLSQLAAELKLTGLVATNTTIMPERGSGGVSGQLLRPRAREVQKLILEQQLPLELIGAGGFTSLSDLWDYWGDGGRAIQVYTAYVYQGPLLLKNFYRGIEQLLRAGQLKTLSDFFALDLATRRELLQQVRRGN
jgi:dihydroorotate dehydrogenase